METKKEEIEELAMSLHYIWWNIVTNDTTEDLERENWNNTCESIKECYRAMASYVLNGFFSKKALNDFYRNKYNGLDITNIIEGEMALANGKTSTIDEMMLKINCSHHKGSKKVHSVV